MESYSYQAETGVLSSKGGQALSYTAQVSCPEGSRSLPHAASAMGANTYSYDCSGNMTQRVIGGSTYNLAYDAENRLSTVSGAASATYVYDGDGVRVKSTVGGASTVTIGSYFEWTGSSSTMKRYYEAGGSRIGMRQGSTLYWLVSDHLGSTSVTANASGGLYGRLLYKAWGEQRWSSGTTPTTYRYTGQRSESSLGLYFYGARWYDPYIAQFTQPDTLIPNPYNPLDWNRYAYARSNPLKYTDPTGNFPWILIPFLIFIATIPGDTGPYVVDPTTAAIGDAALRIVDPADWFYTGVDCLSGNCSGTDILLGMLPLVNGGLDDAVDAARALDNAAEQAGESIIKAINPPTYRGGLRGAMERLGNNAPTGMLNPQVHHNLPWIFRDWFAGAGRGLDVNDPQFGRWVSGSPQGPHQRWTREYNDAWREFIEANPNATRQDVLNHLQHLLDSGRYPGQ